MALTEKKYEKFYKETGSGTDKITTANKDYIKTVFEYSATHGFSDIIDDYRLGPIIYMMQQMQDELDYLRTEISANKDKTGITTVQANAITANTAKTGITSQQANTITANDKAVNNNASSISSNQTAISNLTPEVVAAIKVGAYPPVLYAPPGFIQTHTSEVVYDTRLKKYFLNISYVEITPGKGGGKATRVVRTGQIELQ